MSGWSANWWWVAAGIAVAAELGTGTFYLLMIALGLAAGAVAAQLGSAPAYQLLAAAAIGGGATALWHWRRISRPPSGPAGRFDLDVGQHVRVDAWARDRTTQVSYRGSTWSARLQPGARPAPGEHVVAAIEGNWLVLAPAIAPN